MVVMCLDRPRVDVELAMRDDDDVESTALVAGGKGRESVCGRVRVVKERIARLASVSECILSIKRSCNGQRCRFRKPRQEESEGQRNRQVAVKNTRQRLGPSMAQRLVTQALDVLQPPFVDAHRDASSGIGC